MAISQGLKDFYVSVGVPPSKIMVSHDGVDLEDFDVSYSKFEARKLAGLPEDKKIILYAGRLDGWKGVRILLDASLLFEEDVMVVVVGGDLNQISNLSREYPRVKFLGYKPYKDLPIYQKSADVLVIPNTSNSEISRLYTSPLKVFSCMASGVPIVASDLPAIREILGDNNSILVTPDSPDALYNGIMNVLDHTDSADIMAKQALSDVTKYSWVERAKGIISSLS